MSSRDFHIWRALSDPIIANILLTDWTILQDTGQHQTRLRLAETRTGKHSVIPEVMGRDEP